MGFSLNWLDFSIRIWNIRKESFKLYEVGLPFCSNARQYLVPIWHSKTIKITTRLCKRTEFMDVPLYEFPWFVVMILDFCTFWNGIPIRFSV